MPRNRWTLSLSKKQEYSRAVERMCATGADLAPWGLGDAWARVIPCSMASYVRSWSGATVFVVRLRIVGLARKTILRGFDLCSPEWEPDAYVLDDPTVKNPEVQGYRMLDKSFFDLREVLNHRVGPEWVLRRGDLMEGWLLAQSFSSAHPRYNRECPMPLDLSIINQFDDVHEVSFKLKVEHVAVQVQPRPLRTRLYDPAKGPSNRPARPGPDVILEKTTARQMEEGSRR